MNHPPLQSPTNSDLPRDDIPRNERRIRDIIRALTRHGALDPSRSEAKMSAISGENRTTKIPETLEFLPDHISPEVTTKSCIDKSWEPARSRGTGSRREDARLADRKFEQKSLPFPETIGRYQVISQLAHGGQADIYHGWDPVLHREVALKRGRIPADPGGASLSRIAQEGAFLAQLEHPGIVRIHDSGIDQECPYLVLEMIPGQALSNEFGQRRPTPRQIREILIQIADALSIAHQHGILHLDLKPENVMITPEGECKLIDFGMGWLLRKKQGPALVFAAGTRCYMAPEQRTGETERWTFATDVYGLGGILHFLQTGLPPSEECQTDQTTECMTANCTFFNTWPFASSLSRIRKKAMSDEIQNRFSNMNDFRQTVRKSLRDLF
ncbi:MAG TPA: serine/threonine-protein kinase [Planctomicrobium sp.]|nr:serine/threonine-protein kinase [Planctomicrobium sp.]